MELLSLLCIFNLECVYFFIYYVCHSTEIFLFFPAVWQFFFHSLHKQQQSFGWNSPLNILSNHQDRKPFATSCGQNKQINFVFLLSSTFNYNIFVIFLRAFYLYLPFQSRLQETEIKYGNKYFIYRNEINSNEFYFLLQIRRKFSEKLLLILSHNATYFQVSRWQLNSKSSNRHM